VRTSIRPWLCRAFFLALLLPSVGAAEPQWGADRPGAELAVALLTVAPGEIYWQRFGHNAILIEDRVRGTATLYNYGLFDFSERDFFLNFIRGRMRYAMGVGPPSADLAGYRAEGREVRLQWLAMSPPQRRALRDFLDWNLRPENLRYAYDYFETNCSTKVRDALDAALSGAIHRATASRSRGDTYRSHALRLTAPDLPLYLGIHAGLGPYADRRLSFWQEMFVPMELARHLAEVRIIDDAGNTHPLVEREEVLLPAILALPPAAAPNWFWRFLAAGIFLAGLIVWLAPRGPRALAALLGTLWLLAGLGGLVLLGLWFGTEHRSAWANHNLLLFNPLALALLPAAFALLRARPVGPLLRQLAVGMALIALAAWFVLVLPWFDQDAMDWIGFWAPIHLAAAAALRTPALRSR
jgi:hypothetical protein